MDLIYIYEKEGPGCGRINREMKLKINLKLSLMKVLKDCNTMMGLLKSYCAMCHFGVFYTLASHGIAHTGKP